MHILHIIVGLDIGGAELMLSRLINGNREPHVMRHSVVSLTDLGVVGESLRASGVEVHALGMKGPFGVPANLLRLRRLIVETRPDVVQTWMYHADFLGGLAARWAGHRRIMWGIRATHVSLERSRSAVWLRRACAWLSRHVPETIICAAEASRIAHVNAGYDGSRMLVIANGFDVDVLQGAYDQRAAQRQALGFCSNDVVVGAIGRFNPVKDFETFVASAGLVARTNPEARFLLIGRNLDASNAALMGWINATGVPDRFTLLGERPDVPVCLAAMDVFCLSSRSEGFPNVVGEAMAVGVPVAVTDVGDAALLVGDTGRVVQKADPPALADAVREFVSMTPVDRRAAGLRAQARIRSNFSVDVARQNFAAAYRQPGKFTKETN